MNVIARIDEIMKKQGLTDYQLSKLSGLSPSTISNLLSAYDATPVSCVIIIIVFYISFK